MFERLNAAAFADLKESWAGECQEGDSIDDYATPSMEFAKSECDRDLANYGIFALKVAGEAVAIAHVNCARLPQTEGKTVRVHWILLSPKHDYQGITAQQFATISAAIILGAHQLAKNVFDAQHVKIHLGSAVDRVYFSTVAIALAAQAVFVDPAVRGQWLHFSL